MASSAKIQEIILKRLSDNENHSVQDLKDFIAQTGTNYTEGQFAGSITTLQRNGKIRKLERGVYSLNSRSEDMRKCLIICPIGDEGSQTRANADKLLKHIIVPICEECGFNPVRVDKINDANSITQTIIEHLEEDDLVIADITEHNPNVFYEMGYRARAKKPMIYLRRKGESLPFDVNTMRTYEYDLTDLDSVEDIKQRLSNTISTFTFQDTEVVKEENPGDNVSPAVMQILYQILDSIKVLKEDIKSEVNKFNSDTIGAIVRSMQPVQPQISDSTALQMQLISGLMKNPENFIKLFEISEKINNKKQ